MVKPGGSTCNLNCTYCYYLDKALQYGGCVQKMQSEMLEEYIRQYCLAVKGPEITFCWHGGEPLVLGVDYYRKALKLIAKYATGKKVFHSIQTNGVLINAEWAQFFAENHFLVGVSIDGPKDIHDAYRLNKGGKPTFDKVMAGIELLKRFKVEYNTLSVVSDLCAGRGAEIYRFFKSIGSHYMQFLPAVEHTVPASSIGKPSYNSFGRDIIVPPTYPGASLASWSIGAADYGKFMCDIFDEWVKTDVGSYYVTLFDATLCQYAGVQPGYCAMCESCGDDLIVEFNGDVYPCDHFVYPEYKLGNILTQSFEEIYRNPRRLQFGLEKRNSLPRECLACKWYFACRGECPKHRFEADGRNTLCEGLKMYFEHVDPYMQKMLTFIKQGLPPSQIMKTI